MEGGERGGCSERCPGGRLGGEECEGPLWEHSGQGSSRGVKGKALGQGPRGRVPVPVTLPSGQAAVLGQDPSSEVQRLKEVGAAFFLSPPPHYFQTFFHLQQAICQR